MDMSDFGQVFVCLARIAQRAANRTFREFPHVYIRSSTRSCHAPGSTSATALPAFEVAAIKLNQSGSGSSHSDTNDGRFNATLPELAEALTQELSRELGRDIIDKTEIKGRYDLTLKWTQDAGATTDSAASSADSGPSIFTAVLEQLGLKLEPAKAPVQVLVIDHAEMPSEN
jgi:hypothetical protein